MQKLLPALTIIFPLLAFGTAATIEVVSTMSPARKARSLAPIALGILVYILFWGPEISRRFVVPGMHWLTLYSAAIASSGAIIPYSRRLSSVLVCVGGLELVYVGTFFSQPIT